MIAKKIIALGAIALLVWHSFSVVGFNERSKTIEILLSFPEPVIENKTILGKSYHIITMGNLSIVATKGEPRLPAKFVNILLPPGTKIGEIKVTASKKIFLGKGYHVEPQAIPFSFSSHIPSQPLYQDDAIYNSSEPFPGEIYRVEGVHYFRGYPILLLALYPLQYIPKEGELFYHEKASIVVKIKEGEINEMFRALPQDERRVKQLVDNPSILYSFSSTPPTSLSTNYKYIIITNASLESAFQTLIEYKSRFISAKMVNLTFIQNNYEGNDLQEKIRNFIKYAYQNWGAEYILLGGDDEIIPHRGFYGYVPSEPPEEDYDIPADLYYAALDGTWDDNGNGVYGELADNPDWYAEVYVGRAPVNTVTEATNFVNKVIAFETTNKPNVIQLHQSRLEHDNIPDSTVTPEACAQWIPNSYIINKLYEENGTVTKTKWRDAFSDGRLIVQHIGHGSVNEYFLNFENGGAIIWYGSDALRLINSFYPIYIAPICLSGAFDYNDCIGEKYLLNEEGGTSACILNSRYGWYSPSNAHTYSGEFAERQFYELFEEGRENLGKMMQIAKEHFSFSANANPTYRWCYYEINLLGDPETPVLTTRSYNGSVHNINKDIYYDTIQAAIDDANPGDTLEVSPTLYKENIVINKKINLFGRNESTTIIDGSGVGSVINITADWVNISGFTISNGGNLPDAGIKIYHSSNNTITNCTIINNHCGIWLYYSSNNKFRNITLENNIYNFGIYGGDITHFYHDIDDSNRVNGNPIYYIIGQSGLIFNSTKVGYLGLVSCNDIVIKNVTFSNNYQGLLLANTSYSLITSCTFHDNFIGIFSSNSSHNHIHYSNIFSNSNYGICNHHSEPQCSVDATYNYWGDESGPYHAFNLNGKGDNVSNNVEFIPWLTAYVKGAGEENVGEGENFVDMMEEVDTTLQINVTANASITVILYEEAPVEETDAKSVGKYIDIFIKNESAVIWPINITIYYTQKDLDDAGITEGQLLGIYFFNESSNEWELYNDTGVNTTDIVVNGKQYAGYAWANIWHLTKLTICGDVKPPQTSYSLSPSLPSGENGWYVENVTVTLNAIDDISGVNKIFYRINSGNWIKYTTPFKINGDGEYLVNYYSIDKVGNKEAEKSFSLKIDRENPETTYSLNPSSPNGKNNWYTLNVSVTLTSYDETSGVGTTKYRIDNGNWQNYGGEFTISMDGEHHIEYYSTDNAGNVEATKTFTIEIDKTNPQTTYDIIPNTPDGENGWYIANVTFLLHPMDTTSGIDKTYYMLNGEKWKVYDAPIHIFLEGENVINFYSIDIAGNKEPMNIKIIKIDKTPPTVIIKKPEEGYLYLFGRAIVPLPRNKTIIIGGITVEVNATDEPSGIKGVKFYVDENPVYEDFNPPYSWDWRIALGRHELKVVAFDEAGHMANKKIKVTIFSIF